MGQPKFEDYCTEHYLATRKLNTAVEDHPEFPSELGPEAAFLGFRILFEEVVELAQALGLYYDSDENEGYLRLEVTSHQDFEFQTEEAADACVDIIVLADRLLSAMGIPDKPLKDEVARANLDKIKDGVRLRSDGKILKPEGWAPPDVSKAVWKFVDDSGTKTIEEHAGLL